MRGLGVRVFSAGSPWIPGSVSFPAAHAIECNRFAATSGWFRFWSEIELDRFPSIAALRLQAEAGGRLVTAVDHAILTTRIARHTIDNAVLIPFYFFEQFRIARVMRV